MSNRSCKIFENGVDEDGNFCRLAKDCDCNKSSPQELFRMMTLLKGLELEIKGLKRRGRSAYSIVKEEFNLKGNRVKVRETFKEIVEQKIEEASKL